jgi:hypothetical protein
MIKNTIIVILLLLLIITFYSYVCLSSNMLNYEKERIEFILTKESEIKNKESEIKNKESKLIEMVNCNEQLTKYQNTFNKISSDLNEAHI